MVQRVQTLFVSDLSGDDLGHDVETVTFSYEGAEYEIDLSPQEYAVLDQTLANYAAHGRRIGGRRKSRRAKTPNRDASELSDIRRWARENNHPVSDRGRISTALREAYRAAH